MAYGALSIFEAGEEMTGGEGDIEHDLLIHCDNGSQDESQWRIFFRKENLFFARVGAKGTEMNRNDWISANKPREGNM